MFTMRRTVALGVSTCTEPAQPSRIGPTATLLSAAPFSAEELQIGMEVELELGHECAPSPVDALDEDLLEIGKAAIANLQERSDYYRLLTQAHAPGDPPAPPHRHVDVGCD